MYPIYEERRVVQRLIQRKRLKGRLFINIHTGKLCIVRFMRTDHIYFAGDGWRGRQYKTIFPQNFERVA